MLFVSAKVSQYALLPQGKVESKQRVLNMVKQMDDEGFGNCTNTGACEVECPKGISLKNIARMNSEYLSSTLKPNSLVLKNSLQIAAIQFDIKWESKHENLRIIEKYLSKISETDIVLLPEMFTTGFTMQAQKFSENMEGETIKWMEVWSKKLDSAIGGSIIISEGSKIYNRFVFVTPEKEIFFYDKRHTFTLANENNIIPKEAIWEFLNTKVGRFA